MELFTKTRSGNAVRLVTERDEYAVHQIYAYLTLPGGAAEERCLCHGWGARKTRDGIVQGVLAPGQMLEIPKADWTAIVTEREDLRARENLADIHLVKIFSHGDQLTIDAYTLSANVDRETWTKIKPHMHFVDSAVNDELYAGDRFVGWVVQEGQEEEVERILGVKPESLIRARIAGGFEGGKGQGVNAVELSRGHGEGETR